MEIRPYRAEDAAALARLSAASVRGETDFVLNPLWTSEDELRAEFARRCIAPETHLLVADPGDGEAIGMSGFLRAPDDELGGLICPIVGRSERGQGVGGELLRAALKLGAAGGIRLATAGIGTRNRAGYSLLTAHGFRPVRQHFFMRCDAPVRSRALAGLELGEARAEDLGEVLEIYRECEFEARSEERMRELFEDGIHFHGVAKREGRIVGFVEIETHWPERVWVAYVGVRSAQRDRGIGSGLVSFGIERCIEAGAKHALLLLSPANRTAVRAYEKVGFRRFRLIDVLEREL